MGGSQVDLSGLVFIPITKIECPPEWMVKNVWLAVLPFQPDINVIGFDPGRNYGFTYIRKDGSAYIHNGTLSKSDYVSYGKDLFHLACDVAEYFDNTLTVIEGASYGDKYGQVGLAYMRFGLYLGSLMGGTAKVEIVAPRKINKQVFGSGKTNGKYTWTSIDHNAADSLVIALYAAGYNHLSQSVNMPILPNK